MDRKSLLMEQYKLVEQRRNYFGVLFWQMPGFLVAVFAVFIGLASGDASNLIRPAFVVGGMLFLLIAWIAYRLRASQDECEALLSQIESELRREIDLFMPSLPRSSRYGARTATIIGLVLAGVGLLMTAAFSGF